MEPMRIEEQIMSRLLSFLREKNASGLIQLLKY